MRWIATLLSATATIVFLANCADASYTRYNRALTDPYSRYDCQFYNHDFNYCR
jgi:hypothetical protein